MVGDNLPHNKADAIEHARKLFEGVDPEPEPELSFETEPDPEPEESN